MRITKVTTKTGDAGKTSLADGQRITKNHPIINALGDLDHLNSIIGWAEVASSNKIYSQELKNIQQVESYQKSNIELKNNLDPTN